MIARIATLAGLLALCACGAKPARAPATGTPCVEMFQVTPLASGAGVHVTWHVPGADTVVITPKPGIVAASGEADVAISVDTELVLVARIGNDRTSMRRWAHVPTPAVPPAVDGQVVDAAGNGVAGLQVSVGGTDVVTDAAGAFTALNVSAPYDVWLRPVGTAGIATLYPGVSTDHPVLPLDPSQRAVPSGTEQDYSVDFTVNDASGAPDDGGRHMTVVNIVGTTIGAAPLFDAKNVAGTEPLVSYGQPAETSFDVFAYRGLAGDDTTESTFDTGAYVHAPLTANAATVQLDMAPIQSAAITVHATGWKASWSLWRYRLLDGRQPFSLGVPLVASASSKQVHLPTFGPGTPALRENTDQTECASGWSDILHAVDPATTDVSESFPPVPILDPPGGTIPMSGSVRWNSPSDSVCTLAVDLAMAHSDYGAAVVTGAQSISLDALGVSAVAQHGDTLFVDLACITGYRSLDEALVDPLFALRWARRAPYERSEVDAVQYTIE